jgi:hypothetical protein
MVFGISNFDSHQQGCFGSCSLGCSNGGLGHVSKSERCINGEWFMQTKIMLLAGGLLLAALAISVTNVVWASNEGASGETLVIPDASSDTSSVMAGRNSAYQPTDRQVKNHNVMGKTVAAKTGSGVPSKPVVAGDRFGVKVFVAGVGILLGLVGFSLVVYCMVGQMERHTKKVAYTAILAENAGQRRRRDAVVPATLPFNARKDVDAAAVSPSDETEELRRAA